MSKEIEQAKKCAIQTLKKLHEHYEIDETDPIIQASTTPLSKIHFSFMFNPTLLEFELKNPLLINNPDVKERLDVLNRHLRLCLEKK